jgi:secreted trypsin-like serine protease
MNTLLSLFLFFPFAIAQQQCGQTPIKPELEGKHQGDKIVGGSPAIPGSWPWQISLRRDASKYHTCGGVIICRNLIMIAAHCVYNNQHEPGIFRVDAGRYFKDEDTDGITKHNVEEIVVHERYSPFTIDSDIALLKISPYITYENHTQPVCLPDRDAQVGEVAHFSGWGQTMGTGWDGFLKQAALPVLDQTVCRNWMGSTVSNNMICTGKPAGDVSGCMGDSGGPLVIKNGNSWSLVGLVSWGRRTCSGVNTASVFCRVRNFVSNGWVQEKIQYLGGCL